MLTYLHSLPLRLSACELKYPANKLPPQIEVPISITNSNTSTYAPESTVGAYIIQAVNQAIAKSCEIQWLYSFPTHVTLQYLIVLKIFTFEISQSWTKFFFHTHRNIIISASGFMLYTF